MRRLVVLAFVSLSIAAARSLAYDAFVGEWVAVEEHPTDLARIKIWKSDDVWMIEVWGAARGGEISAGKVPLILLADTARAGSELKYGYASWDLKFADLYVTLDLERPWHITAEDFWIFKDGSERLQLSKTHRLQAKAGSETARLNACRRPACMQPRRRNGTAALADEFCGRRAAGTNNLSVLRSN